MQTVFRWTILGALVVSPAVAVAQTTHGPYQTSTPSYGGLHFPRNYGRYNHIAQRDSVGETAPLPAAEAADAVGSGIERAEPAPPEPDLGRPMTIPQQGAIDLGTGMNAGCAGCGAMGCNGGCDGSMLIDTGHPSGGWFGGLYYVVLFRDADRRGTVLGYDDVDPSLFISTGTSHMKEGHGLGVRVGKMLNACTAVEGIYWQVFPDDVTGGLYSSQTPGSVNSTLSFAGLEYDDGSGAQPVDNFYQDTQLLEVRRGYDYRNFELNLLRLPFVFGGPYSKARVALLGGVRYFSGKESLGFATDPVLPPFGNDVVNELAYYNEVENHLVGFQLGGMLDYQLTNCLSVQVGSKAGVYNNHMKIHQSLVGGNGGATITTGPFTGQAFGVDSKNDDVAFLAELDAGLAYCFHPQWRVTAGYKLIGVSAYAQAADQIPYDFTDLGSAAYIKNQDSLILHGVYVGAEYAW